jgi:hypothetical protein
MIPHAKPVVVPGTVKKRKILTLKYSKEGLWTRIES